jgi:amino acid transporter
VPGLYNRKGILILTLIINDFGDRDGMAMQSKKKKLSWWQFLLMYTITGGIAGFIISSIIKRAPDWNYPLTWFIGCVIAFLLVSLGSR